LACPLAWDALAKTDCARARQRGDEIEPVHPEIVEHEVLDLVEGRAGGPAVVPVQRDMGRDDIADQPRAHRLAHPRLVRRPAAVLVDGELHAPVLGQLHEVLAHTQIGDEGFLAQHVLARLQAPPR
jgi:hypothetical protein